MDWPLFCCQVVKTKSLILHLKPRIPLRVIHVQILATEEVMLP